MLASLKEFFSSARSMLKLSARLYRLVEEFEPGAIHKLALIVVLLAVLPYGLTAVIAAMVEGAKTKDVAILWLGGGFAAFLLVRRLLELVKMHQVLIIKNTVERRLATFIPEAYSHLELRAFDAKEPYSNLLKRGEDGRYQMIFYLPAQVELLGAMISAVVGSVVLVSVEPRMAGLIVLGLFFAAAQQFANAAKQVALERSQDPYRGFVTMMRNQFMDKSYLKPIVLLGLDQPWIKRFGDILQEIHSAMRNLSAAQARRQGWTHLLLAVSIAGAVWLMVKLLFAGALGVGVIAFLLYTIVGLHGVVEGMVRVLAQQHVSGAKVEDLLTLLDKKESWFGGDKKEVVIPPRTPLPISINHLDFSYGSLRLFDDISLFVPAGAVKFLVGENGSGKTTLLNIICRLEQVPNEVIKVGEYDLNNLLKVSLRRRITHLAQEGLPIRISVRRFLSDAVGVDELDEDIIWQSLDLATVANEIRGFPKGLDEEFNFMFGNRESSLSGGERQKLALAAIFARILVGEASVIIVDEPFSAIDPKARQEILRNLLRLVHHEGLTMLFVTHDLRALERSDEVIFFEKRSASDNGKVRRLPTKVHAGSHQQLIDSCPAYADLVGKAWEERGSAVAK